MASPLITTLGQQVSFVNSTGTNFGAVDGTGVSTGCIGEILSATGTSVTVAANTNVVTCSINFTAGNWLLFSNSLWNAATLTTPVQFLTFYGTAAGNNQTGIDGVKGASVAPTTGGPSAASAYNQVMVPSYFSTVSPSTLYLKAFCALTAGTNVVDSYFWAIRLGPPKIG